MGVRVLLAPMVPFRRCPVSAASAQNPVCWHTLCFPCEELHTPFALLSEKDQQSLGTWCLGWFLL